MVIHEIFSSTVTKFPGKVALQIKRDNRWERFTYKDLEVSSLKIGAFLIKEGLNKGECVSIILENCPEWAMIYLGIMYAGLTCVPLDPQLSPQEIKNLITDSQTKAIFCSQELFNHKIKLATEGLSIKIICDFSVFEQISTENIIWPEVTPEDIASLIYTSGTTGKPKGVLLAHKNFCANFLSLQKLNFCFPSDNFLSILPLYHSYAFMATLIMPLFSGAKVTYSLSLNPHDITQIIQEANVTIVIGVPQFFSLIHRTIFEKIKKFPFFLRPFILPFIRFEFYRRMKSWRISVSGGARLEPKIARELSRIGLKVIEGYGLTETSPVVTLNLPEKVKFGSVGKPIPDVQVKIFNPDSSGLGQVLIKGPNVMEGYFKNQDLTKQVIKDGWFYTSDLGYLDRNGYLFLVSREEELIVLSSGKNIYPEELEEYYLKSPHIKEMCIILKQEESFGRIKDSLFAVVVPNLEYFAEKKELNIYEKIRWDLDTLGRTLPSYKHIMGFMLTKEELPRTPLRKVKRFAVRQKYLQKRPTEIKAEEKIFTEEDGALLNKEIAKKIMRYISGEIKKPTYLDSHLEIDLGIDSLTRVELGLGLEALLKTKIPDEMLYRISTVKDIIVTMQDLLEKPKIPKEAGVKKEWRHVLRELPPEEILKKIKLDFGLLNKSLTFLFKNIYLFIFRIFWFFKIEGRHNLPKQGPYLICPNHASYLDGLFIFSALPLRIIIHTYFLGYQQILEHPLLGWVNKSARFLTVDTSAHLAEAMQAVSYILSHKKIVCIFPEGMRSIDEKVKEFKKGVGILVKELDIPVVPVYIKGSHYAWPRGRRLPRFYPIKVVFGKPFSLQELIKSAKERLDAAPESYETIARQLREEVLKLSHD
jgi:long-chain acyl-CoA synthetase